ncbi:hypothetical protein F2P56_015608 [Juglans regia]|uniref:BED-type domain-containing protein n=1 Tax=Juglans regia TaxID=51240 RepID=A0A833XFM9_JUGRE|nr:hypothetical protein F2P56_015608 [Juglans regia]
MSSCQSTGGTSTTLAPARSEDPAWAHARVVPGARNNTECVYCNKLIRGGGITRLKYHLARIPGNVEACKKVSDDVKWQMKELINEMKKIRGRKKNVESGKSVRELSRFFTPRTTHGSQPSIKSAMCSKEMIDKAKMVIAYWWYDANLPFSAAQSKFYQPAIDAIASIGPGFKGPSLYEFRGNLIKNSMNEVHNYVQKIKNIWNETSCSLMADGLTNQRQQQIINFLVYCPKSTMFLKSIDTSGLRKDSETLFNIFDEVFQEVGVENLVQFITDNDASYKATGKKLQQKYGSFYWFPCAAH